MEAYWSWVTKTGSFAELARSETVPEAQEEGASDGKDGVSN